MSLFKRNNKQSSGVVPRRRLSESTPKHKVNVPTDNTKASGITFRRNRTITGSTSANIQSATEPAGVMQSPRATAHNLRKQRRSLSSMLAVFVVCLILLGFLLVQFTADIRVAVVGQVRPLTNQQQERIVGPIADYLNVRPLERFRIMLDKDNLASYLQQQGVRDVEGIESVRSDGIGSSVLTVKVREPVARWSIAGQERYVDKNGIIFAVNYFDRPTVSIIDDSGISAQSEAEARSVTSGRFLAFIGRSVSSLSSQGLSVESVVIPPNTTRQVDIVISGAQGPVSARMTIDRPSAQQSEDAARAYNYLEGQSRLPQYIDVRVSGKAFYRPT